jgi:KDO2-lipid IV(A) lauroyltransferase
MTDRNGRNLILYYFMQALTWVLSQLPPALLDRMAYGIGWMAFSILRIRRSLILQNLRIAFPEKSEAERTRIAAASFYHFASTMLELLSVRNGTLGNTVTLHGETHIREALTQNRGIYIISGHQGNWEAMAAALASRIQAVYVVVKPVGSPGTDRFLTDLRKKNGIFRIQRKKKGDGMRGMVEAMQRNAIVGFMVDQARPGAPFLPFFGKLAKTNTSMAYIWSQQKAPLVAAHVRRISFGRHEVTFSPPFDLKTTEDAAADVRTHSGQFNTAMEDMIRNCPEQYLWMHNRWKGSPDL